MSSPQQDCQKILDDAVQAKDGVPGIVFGMMDRNGTYLAKCAAGKIGADRDEEMALDSIFSLHSCTKNLANMAIMHAVENRALALDDPVEDILPEIRNLTLLDGSPVTNKITLRMLMTHQAGFGYTFFNEPLKTWADERNLHEFSGKWEAYQLPLSRQPGQGWEYGINIDWAGKALEAATGMTLEDYSQKHIFGPLGCEVLSYRQVPDAMKKRWASLHQIVAGDKVVVREQLECSAQGFEFDSGGGGCIGTLDDYLKCLVVLVNEGKGANGAQILNRETVEEMWKDQLTGTPAERNRDLYQTTTPAKPEFSGTVEICPGMEKGWAIPGCITKDPWPTGRSANSVWWAGLGNLYWMADRQKGAVNIIMSQMLPFHSMKTLTPWFAAETACYSTMK